MITSCLAACAATTVLPAIDAIWISLEVMAASDVTLPWMYCSVKFTPYLSKYPASTASGQSIMLAVSATQAPFTALAVPGAEGLAAGAVDAAGLPEEAGFALALGAPPEVAELGAGAAAEPQPARSSVAEAAVPRRKARREMWTMDIRILDIGDEG